MHTVPCRRTDSQHCQSEPGAEGLPPGLKETRREREVGRLRRQQSGSRRAGCSLVEEEGRAGRQGTGLSAGGRHGKDRGLTGASSKSVPRRGEPGDQEFSEKALKKHSQEAAGC